MESKESKNEQFNITITSRPISKEEFDKMPKQDPGTNEGGESCSQEK